MAAARRIGVRELVDQHEARAALQDGVEIHFRQHLALIEDALLGNDFEALGQKVGLDAAMGFDDADHHIDAVEAALTRLRQHFVGLADAGRGAEKNLQPAARLAASCDACFSSASGDGLESRSWPLVSHGRALRTRSLP